MKHIFLLLSAVLPLYSPIPYIRSILRGETTPHRTTRLVYLIIAVLTTAALIAGHDTVALWISAATLLQSIVLFFLGLKYGVGGWSKTDIMCLSLALVGVIAWQRTTDPTLGLYFGILADFMGTIPTLLKTWHAPESEDWQYYTIDAIAGFLNILAIPVLTVHAIAYPLYLVVVNVLVALFTRKGKLSKKKRP